MLVRHDRKPQLTQVVEFEAQVLPLKRRATWAKRVLLDQYLAVTLPSIRGRLHMHLLGSLLLCFFHLIDQTRDGLRPVELDHDLLDAIRPCSHPARAARTGALVHQVLNWMNRIFGRVGDRRHTGEVERAESSTALSD